MTGASRWRGLASLSVNATMSRQFLSSIRQEWLGILLAGEGHDLDFVAIRVAQERSVVVRIVFRSHARRSLVRPAMGKTGFVTGSHSSALSCVEGEVRPVPSYRPVAVNGFFNAEDRLGETIRNDPLWLLITRRPSSAMSGS